MEKYELMQRQLLPLDIKLKITDRRIKEFHKAVGGHMYVSWSGGKDSTVLVDRVCRLYPDTPIVFSDTGLEYPEVREFVRARKGVVIVKPKMTYLQVIKKYGYPVISKEQSLYIRQYRTTKSEYLKGVRWKGKNGRFKISERWKFLVDAPFKISEQCCDVLKNQPLNRFRKITGLCPLIGNMASDSLIRERIYLREGCNSFKPEHEYSTPLGFWTEKDIWEYINKENLPYSKIYDKGVDRTGCLFCLFGIHKEKNNRFEILKQLHPKLYDYCMNQLGEAKVIEYIMSRGGKQKSDTNQCR